MICRFTGVALVTLLATACPGDVNSPADAARDLAAKVDLSPAPVEGGTPEGGAAEAGPADTSIPDSGVDQGSPPGDGPCVPSCGGKTCGGDGCGGSCGSCQAWQKCTGGQCACATPLPPGWPTSWSAWSHNPVLVATTAVTVQGQDNVYAPEIHALSGGYAMWYGAQGSDGHDRIFVATSTDRVEWRRWPTDAAPKAALDRGSSNHVNDPSVVKVGGTWRMYYTDAATGIDDRIWLATSSSLTGFTKQQQVLGPGASGSWESLKVGRPAVLYENGVYKMWYDGQDGKARHVGYATSTDGKTFVRHPQNPVLKNAGAVDVKNVGGVYVMLREAGDGTYWATSVDGVHCWTDRGKLFGKSGKAYDAYGQVTPFLELAGSKPVAVWFGGAKVSTWNKNRIAAALPQGGSLSGGGCTACTPAGWSCPAACQGAGAAAGGTCAVPGSTSPGSCCACFATGCESCLGGAVDCHAACVGTGKAGGYCGNPGSTNPGSCCGCWD